MKAPNGKPSNLTPEQYRLVRTPAFKEWFGDWENSPKTASKVVDENGEPLVVWHGSKSLFNEFTLLPETSEAGFHFGTLSQAEFRIKSSKEKYFYQCFLSIKNVIETDDMVFFSKHKIALKLKDQGVFSNEEYQNWGKFYKTIKEKGIDGLRYLNKWEGSGYSYIVFYPEQIKLADGSNTAFDPENPDIRFDGGGTTEKFKINKSANKGEYFGTYRGVEWSISPLRDGKTTWYYITQNGVELDQPTTIKNDAFKIVKDNIDFDLDRPDLMSAGGKTEETYQKWKKLVNMSKGELEKFYDSQEGKDAGLSPGEAKEEGIDSGRESARWIMKMKDTRVSDWTPEMWRWAKKQISFISRMSGNKGPLYDEKGNKTRKHTSLLIWGHNPEKYSEGGEVGELNSFQQLAYKYKKQISNGK